MKILESPLSDALVFEPEPSTDNRGRFTRIFCKRELKGVKNLKEIVQINRSLTRTKGAVRGMHFQYPPRTEAKIVSCLSGSVFDVIVDLRHGAPSFLKWHAEVLTGENMKMVYVPEGFAHGFQTLEEDSELLYCHTEFYSPEYEGGISYDDPMINISWPLKVTDISERDRGHRMLTHDFNGLVL